MCGLHYNANILDKITKKEDRYELSHTPMLYKRSYDYDIEKFFKNYFHDNESVNMIDKTLVLRFIRNVAGP